MKKSIVLLSAALLLLVLPAAAQRGNTRNAAPSNNAATAPHNASTPRANQGHVPPPPPSRATPSNNARPGGEGGPVSPANTRSDAERYPTGHINETPHVNHDTWYGHEAPNDPRFHIDHPFEHGHFANFGPDHRYGISRIDAEHHWFWFPGGGYFFVADWDWSVFSDWCWNCGDDFVVYEDPDHPGWYLLYNSMTGAYIHVQYMGM